MLIMLIILLYEIFKLIYLSGMISLFLLIIINSLKINYKNNFFKSLKLSIISFLMPGVGLIARIFLKDKTFKGLYTQR